MSDEEMMAPLLPQSIGPSVQVEKMALRATQDALRERTSSAAIALMLASLVLACLPDRSAFFLPALRAGGVWLAALFCAASLFSICRFLRACQRLQAAGLYRRARGIRSRWSWELAGAFVSLAVVATACAAFGWQLRSVGAGALPGLFVAVWLGRRLNQIPSYEAAREEQNQAISLKQVDD